MPLSNSSVSRKIDEMGQGVQQLLGEKLKSQKFLLQVNECTIPKSESLLLAYVRCLDKEKFQLLFCQSRETTTRGVDIYNKLNDYFDNHKILKPNFLLFAAGGSPAADGSKHRMFKIDKG